MPSLMATIFMTTFVLAFITASLSPISANPQPNYFLSNVDHGDETTLLRGRRDLGSQQEAQQIQPKKMADNGQNGISNKLSQNNLSRSASHSHILTGKVGGPPRPPLGPPPAPPAFKMSRTFNSKLLSAKTQKQQFRAIALGRAQKAKGGVFSDYVPSKLPDGKDREKLLDSFKFIKKDTAAKQSAKKIRGNELGLFDGTNPSKAPILAVQLRGVFPSYTISKNYKGLMKAMMLEASVSNVDGQKELDRIKKDEESEDSKMLSQILEKEEKREQLEKLMLMVPSLTELAKLYGDVEEKDLPLNNVDHFLWEIAQAANETVNEKSVNVPLAVVSRTLELEFKRKHENIHSTLNHYLHSIGHFLVGEEGGGKFNDAQTLTKLFKVVLDFVNEVNEQAGSDIHRSFSVEKFPIIMEYRGPPGTEGANHTMAEFIAIYLNGTEEGVELLKATNKTVQTLRNLIKLSKELDDDGLRMLQQGVIKKFEKLLGTASEGKKYAQHFLENFKIELKNLTDLSEQVQGKEIEFRKFFGETELSMRSTTARDLYHHLVMGLGQLSAAQQKVADRMRRNEAAAKAKNEGIGKVKHSEQNRSGDKTERDKMHAELLERVKKREERKQKELKDKMHAEKQTKQSGAAKSPAVIEDSELKQKRKEKQKEWNTFWERKKTEEQSDEEKRNKEKLDVEKGVVRRKGTASRKLANQPSRSSSTLNTNLAAVGSKRRRDETEGAWKDYWAKGNPNRSNSGGGNKVHKIVNGIEQEDKVGQHQNKRAKVDNSRSGSSSRNAKLNAKVVKPVLEREHRETVEQWEHRMDRQRENTGLRKRKISSDVGRIGRKA